MWFLNDKWIFGFGFVMLSLKYRTATSFNALESFQLFEFVEWLNFKNQLVS